jgi:2-iminobutanoate/2-iminopropanoate deaminase
MKRTSLRVEPISAYLERYRKGAKAYPVAIAGDMVFVSDLPPFDPETGDIKPVPFARQAELVMAQMKRCLEAAGSVQILSHIDQATASVCGTCG